MCVRACARAGVRACAFVGLPHICVPFRVPSSTPQPPWVLSSTPEHPAEYPRLPHCPRGYSRVPQSTLQSTLRVPLEGTPWVCAGVPQPHGARAPLRPARGALPAPRGARRHHRKVSTPEYPPSSTPAVPRVPRRVPPRVPPGPSKGPPKHT